MSDRSALERRWLDGLHSHGVFHAGSTRDPEGYQFVSGSRTNLPTDVLDEVDRKRMEARFLACASACLQHPVPHVHAAMDAVHDELRGACGVVSAVVEAMHAFRRVHGLVSQASLA